MNRVSKILEVLENYYDTFDENDEIYQVYLTQLLESNKLDLKLNLSNLSHKDKVKYYLTILDT